jgi:hypothetical protein
MTQGAFQLNTEVIVGTVVQFVIRKDVVVQGGKFVVTASRGNSVDGYFVDLERKVRGKKPTDPDKIASRKRENVNTNELQLAGKMVKKSKVAETTRNDN